MAKKRKVPEKMPELVAIAARLKKVRKQQGFDNYEHIAYELNMSRSAYWRLESGDNFSLKTLIKVCKHLNVNLEEFFEGVKIPKKTRRGTLNKK